MVHRHSSQFITVHSSGQFLPVSSLLAIPSNNQYILDKKVRGKMQLLGKDVSDNVYVYPSGSVSVPAVCRCVYVMWLGITT